MKINGGNIVFWFGSHFVFWRSIWTTMQILDLPPVQSERLEIVVQTLYLRIWTTQIGKIWHFKNFYNFFRLLGSHQTKFTKSSKVLKSNRKKLPSNRKSGTWSKMLEKNSITWSPKFSITFQNFRPLFFRWLGSLPQNSDLQNATIRLNPDPVLIFRCKKYFCRC